jgi:large subunit ribosomal protein L11
MTKETIEQLIEGGKASPGPPLGPMLGPLGLNINEVIEAINEKTKSFEGMKIPIKLVVDTETKAYEIEVGSPTTSALIKKELGIEKISYAEDAQTYNLTFEQLIKIAKMKESSLLANNFKNVVKEVIGSCVSLGKINIENLNPKEFSKKFESGEFDSKLNDLQNLENLEEDLENEEGDNIEETRGTPEGGDGEESREEERTEGRLEEEDNDRSKGGDREAGGEKKGDEEEKTIN